MRRLLAGQVPYRDFADYLGMGHLYVGGLFTLLFGGRFWGSLVGVALASCLSLVALSAIIGKIIFEKTETALGVALVLLVVMLSRPVFVTGLLSPDVVEAMKYALNGGNSARFLRGMILPVSMILLYLVLMVLPRSQNRILQKWWVQPALVGTIAGGCFAWSNDYGISCWLCITLVFCFRTLWEKRTISDKLRRCAVEVIFAVLMVGVFVIVLTRGHLFGESGWLANIFGTGDYQKWYYISQKTYYLYDVDFSYGMMLQLCAAAYYAVRLAMERGTEKAFCRYGLLGFANLSGFCAVNEYKLLSGNDMKEVAVTVLFFTALYELSSLIMKKWTNRQQINAARVFACIFCGAWILSALKNEASYYILTNKEGIYFKQLGGYMEELGESIAEAESFLGDDAVFATYASAQEALSGKFQPSGIDYIIHVLGDDTRERYLEAFREENFTYAATINEEYSEWEYWVRNANWFFYRELLRDWHPVYQNEYEKYWERNRGTSNVYEGQVSAWSEKISDTKQRIAVKTDEPIDGTADVWVSYGAHKDGSLQSKVAFPPICKFENVGKLSQGRYLDYTFHRGVGGEFIPVTVIDGYGEVVVTSLPDTCTWLETYEVSCDTVYQTLFDYVDYTNAYEQEETVVFEIEKDAWSEEIVDRADRIEICDKSLAVRDVAEDGRYYIAVDKTPEAMEILYGGREKGNMLKVIRG